MAVFRRSALVAILLALVLGSHPASSAVINVEPDLFSAGTVLNTAYSGVTLSVEGSAADVQVSDSGLATTGTRVFGSVALHPFDDKFWDEGTGFLRADFDVWATSVSIDFIYDDDDYGQLRAFDMSNTLLGVVELFSEDPGSATATFNRAQGDIAYIFAGSPTMNLAGTVTGDSILLDNLQVTPIPLPAALPLFLSGLAVFGFVARRRRKAAA